MKILYDTPLSTPDLQPFTNEKGHAMNLRECIVMACTMPAPGDDTLTPQQKFSIGEVAALAIQGHDLTIEQVSLVKDRTGRVFTNPLLVYTIHRVIEGN